MIRCSLIPHIYIPWIKRKRIYTPINSSFHTDLEAGFSSETFNIYQNIQDGDQRAGLNNQAKKEIHSIMKEQNCGFDEARTIYSQRCMKCHSIDPNTGKSTDPKAIFLPNINSKT
ncbi:hypothetical protein PCANB_000640 [Pneumocystis canis]|nr:hypothetical protein PCK1_000687 [Pneumocystis canis]KAG5437603.1 hypothetical protein PCANB_000640 [Pneumocystis canis]